MIKLLHFLFASISLFGLLNVISCKKAVPEEDKIKTEIRDSSACQTCDTCRSFTEDEMGATGALKYAPLERFGPTFNPLNSNEFIYEKIDNKANTGSLIKYNLITKQEQILIPNIQVLDQAKWGVNGWIVFAGWDRKVYKVKDNGDSLTQLTFNVPCLYPELVDQDTKIFYLVTERPADIVGNKIIDLSGKRIDSLDRNEYNYTFTSSNKKKELVGYFWWNEERGLQIYDIQSKSRRTILSYKRSGVKRDEIFAVNWHAQTNKIYYSKNHDGLYRINADGSEKVFLKPNCDTQFYNTISVSPDGKKLLLERINTNPDPQVKGRRIITSELYIMNADGTDERRVF